jgi:hypothetical protein
VTEPTPPEAATPESAPESSPQPSPAVTPDEQQAAPVHRHGSGSLYGWLWRHLPGNSAAKVAILVVAAAVLVVVLFGVVFPWVEPRLPFNQVTVGGG